MISCTHIVEEPENLISEDKMADVLTEIYLHQQASYLNASAGKPLDYARLNLSLLEQQGVKLQDFEESYEYYVLNPDLYESILLNVRNKLENKLPEKDRIQRQKMREEADKKAKK